MYYSEDRDCGAKPEICKNCGKMLGDDDYCVSACLSCDKELEE